MLSHNAHVTLPERNRQHISQLCEKGLHGFYCRCHDEHMLHKTVKKESSDVTRAGVLKEMAKPRMARSAKIAELNLDTTRTREKPTAVMTGTVDKIIPPARPSQSETARINVDGADHRHRHLHIGNALVDEHGDDVKLKKGTHVEVTVRDSET